MDFFNTDTMAAAKEGQAVKQIIHTPVEAVDDEHSRANIAATKKVVDTVCEGWEEF